MADTNNIKKAILVHGHYNSTTGTSNQATGSFVQLYTTGSTTFTSIEYGNMVEPESSFTPSSIISDTFTVSADQTIYGPIARFCLKSGSSGVVAYIK